MASRIASMFPWPTWLLGAKEDWPRTLAVGCLFAPIWFVSRIYSVPGEIRDELRRRPWTR